MDLTRARKELLLENAFLRRPLLILERPSLPPKINAHERLTLLSALPARMEKSAADCPTGDLLRWHRDWFKFFWKRKSGTQPHPKRISKEMIALIRQLAEENRMWGAERIRGELLKLGIKIAKRTIRKYLPKDRHPSGQTWATFLQTHAEAIFVCDFTVVHDLFFRPIYLLSYSWTSPLG